MVGDSFHGRHDYTDVRFPGFGADQTGGVKHAIRAEERTASKFECHGVRVLLGGPAGVHHARQHGWISFRCWFFLYIF
jgi:hypothetical protein